MTLLVMAITPVDMMGLYSGFQDFDSVAVASTGLNIIQGFIFIVVLAYCSYFLLAAVFMAGCIFHAMAIMLPVGHKMGL